MEKRVSKPIMRWTFKREISIGDVMAFGAAILAALYAYSTLDKRLSLVEQGSSINATVQAKRDESQDSANLAYRARVDLALTQINDKLDRLTILAARMPVK